MDLDDKQDEAVLAKATGVEKQRKFAGVAAPMEVKASKGLMCGNFTSIVSQPNHIAHSGDIALGAAILDKARAMGLTQNLLYRDD